MEPTPPRLAPPDAPTLPPRPPPGSALLERIRERALEVPLAHWALAGLALIAAVAALAFTLGGRSSSGPPVEAQMALATAAPTASPTPSTITVDVGGAVTEAGLRILPEGARVADAVEAAGGLTGDADLDRVNLAALLVDAQRVFVPRLGESIPPDVVGGGVGEAPAASPVDVNSADREQLDTLPGVGPATADAIVEHRERSGRFNSVEDLLNVPGIGPAKLDRLRDLVALD